MLSQNIENRQYFDMRLHVKHKIAKDHRQILELGSKFFPAVS